MSAIVTTPPRIRRTAGYEIQQVGFQLSPITGTRLVHLVCGRATTSAQDIETRYCPHCRCLIQPRQGGRHAS